MNATNVKEFLPLIQAWAEGKQVQIQHFCAGTWLDADELSFDGEPASYRVKPEAQLIYMVRHKTGRHSAAITTNREIAEDTLRRCNDSWELVTFTENL